MDVRERRDGERSELGPRRDRVGLSGGDGLGPSGGAPSDAVAATRIAFADLRGWDDAAADALIEGVRRHTVPSVMARPHQAPWLAWFADAAPHRASRAFVECEFAALDLGEGFFTGYYEPVLPASRTPDARFAVPLYRRPPDLLRVPKRADLPGDGTWGRLTNRGAVVPYFDRADIAHGALAGRGLELAWLEDPVDAFFAQVQGSARLVLSDGITVRIGYHGKTGHPYTAIGRVLIDRGVLPEGGATMQTIRAALRADPARAADVLRANRSFVFFREREDPGADLGPVAAGGVALVPWRSLAVDRRHWSLGTPAWVDTALPDGAPFAGVVVAEDTGSAIVGATRGDLFMGSGAAAGEVAGRMQSRGRVVKIVPRRAVEALSP